MPSVLTRSAAPLIFFPPLPHPHFTPEDKARSGKQYRGRSVKKGKIIIYALVHETRLYSRSHCPKKRPATQFELAGPQGWVQYKNSDIAPMSRDSLVPCLAWKVA